MPPAADAAYDDASPQPHAAERQAHHRRRESAPTVHTAPAADRSPAPAAAAAPERASAATAPKRPPPSRDNKKHDRRDDYSWIKVLGYGASCKVLLAQHRKTQRKYAVKVVSKSEAIGNETLIAWLRNERDILKLCNHPSIIKLHEIFTTPAELFYVLEYAAGGELLEYIMKCCRFPVEAIRTICAEIVLALEYLASKGIVHRDLKPENILLHDDHHVKLVDFGTAFLLGQQVDKPAKKVSPDASPGSPAVPLPGLGGADERGTTFCGTYQYLSPEMLGGGRATAAADLWAVGCVTYQMACGSRPFEYRADGMFGLFEQIRHPEQLSYPEHFPEDARALCEQLLVADPARRLGFGKGGPNFPALRRHRLWRGWTAETWAALPTQPLRYDFRSVTPLFVKDVDVLDCKICGAEFTFFVRRHHCRKCGHIFCNRCSKHSVVLNHLRDYGERKVRVCNRCHAKMEREAREQSSTRGGSSFASESFVEDHDLRP